MWPSKIGNSDRKHQETIEFLNLLSRHEKDLSAKADLRMERLLTELVNSRTVQALEAFSQNWPAFSAETARSIPPGLVAEEKPADSTAHDDNLLRLWFLSSLVRRLWLGGDDCAVATAERILLYSPEMEHYTPLCLDWRNGGFIYDPGTELQCALMTLSKACDRAKICRNRDCDNHPLFIGDRSDEAYCSKACFAVARRKSRRTWWDERGATWRASRQINKQRRKPKKRKS